MPPAWKQRHARRKQHFTVIIYSFFNWILVFFFLKMCFSLHGAVHFQSVSPTALQNSVLTTAGKISARPLNTRGKIKRWIILLRASLLLPDLVKHKVLIKIHLVAPEQGTPWWLELLTPRTCLHGDTGNTSHIRESISRVLWSSRTCFCNPQYISY